MFSDILFIPYLREWKIYCDHCTVLHHTNEDQSSREWLEPMVGQPVKFNVIGFGVSEHCVAVMVNLRTQNKVSHITLAVAPGHRPVESNDIVDWVTFSDERPSFIGILDKR